MTSQTFLTQHFNSHPADFGWSAGKVFMDNIFTQTDGFKNLCSTITLDRGNTHFRKNLEHSFADRLQIIFDCFFIGQFFREGPL